MQGHTDRPQRCKPTWQASPSAPPILRRDVTVASLVMALTCSDELSVASTRKAVESTVVEVTATTFNEYLPDQPRIF